MVGNGSMVGPYGDPVDTVVSTVSMLQNVDTTLSTAGRHHRPVPGDLDASDRSALRPRRGAQGAGSPTRGSRSTGRSPGGHAAHRGARHPGAAAGRCAD